MGLTHLHFSIKSLTSQYSFFDNMTRYCYYTITTEDLSTILKRNDIKKSEAYQSRFLEETVPMYGAYMALKKGLIHSWMELTKYIGCICVGRPRKR